MSLTPCLKQILFDDFINQFRSGDQNEQFFRVSAHLFIEYHLIITGPDNFTFEFEAVGILNYNTDLLCLVLHI